MAQQMEPGLHVNEMLTDRSTCRALTALWAERFFRKFQHQSASEYFDHTGSEGVSPLVRLQFHSMVVDVCDERLRHTAI